MKRSVSFVIPVYNEEAVIPELIRQITLFTKSHPKYKFEAVLVENGSTDNSWKLLQKFSLKYSYLKILRLSRNFGCDGGIAAGLRYIKGDAAIIMMADLQEPVELADEFIKKWEQGFEIVYGIVKKRSGGKLRNFNSMLFYKIINRLTNNSFPENASDFRLIDKKVYISINSMPEQNKYLRGLIMWPGFSHTGVSFNRMSRFAGQSKADFSTVLGVALNGIFSFSYLPLRLISGLGFLITLISFGLILFYIYLYFLYGRIAPGIATVIALMLFLFGVLFFTLGIISEYLARIYEEVKRRPLFIVKDKINL